RSSTLSLQRSPPKKERIEERRGSWELEVGIFVWQTARKLVSRSMRSCMPRTRREPTSTDPGPTLRAVPFFAQAGEGPVSLLTRRQRQRLTEISTRVRVPPRMVLYREDTAATTMFFNAGGVVKTYRDLPSGRRWVTGFLFPEDVFGLAQNGVY